MILACRSPVLGFRHVVLPKEIAKLVPKTRLMTENEWRGIGVQQSQGWDHYMIHEPGESCLTPPSSDRFLVSNLPNHLRMSKMRSRGSFGYEHVTETKMPSLWQVLLFNQVIHQQKQLFHVPGDYIATDAKHCGDIKQHCVWRYVGRCPSTVMSNVTDESRDSKTRGVKK